MSEAREGEPGSRPPGDGDPVLRAELQERNKELGFLHHAARIIGMRGEPRDILRATLELLPSAMCQPELASARLCLGSLEIVTRGHESSEPCLRADFDVGPDQHGFVEVCYSSAAPALPVFLDEERSLLESFAQLLQGYFERARADSAVERLVRAEAAQQSALSENLAKDQFLGTVSHELRSSLHVMLGWIQVLQQGPPQPELLARGLQILERNVTLQAKLIEDLMDLSRIVAGKLTIERRRLDLTELVGFAVDAARPAASAKGLTLSAELEAVGDMLGDQQRLQQVVYNILGNAIKFTPRGGRVSVALRRRGPSAALSVTDTGPGIDSALLPHVFERFRQADAARQGRSSGLGLGLPIARTLVELHEGTISVHSARPAPGTTIEICLPLEQ